MKNFAIYLIGMLCVIAGLAYAAYLLNVATHWILVGVAIIVGIGIMTGVVKVRSRQSPAQPNDSSAHGQR